MSSHAQRADRLTQVRAQVDYHHQRLLLYQRLHGSRPSARLAELEHAYVAARDRMTDASRNETPARVTGARSPLD